MPRLTDPMTDPSRSPAPFSVDWHRRRSRRQALLALGAALGIAVAHAPAALGWSLGSGVRRGGRGPLADASRLIGIEQISVVPETRKPQPVQQATLRPQLRMRIAQLLLVGFTGTSVDGSSAIVRDVVDRGLGGVVLFDRFTGSGRVRNIASPTQLANLTATLQAAAGRSALGTPLLVAVDQEGGQVARLNPRDGFPGTYSAAVLGRMNDPAFTQGQGRAIAQQLAAAGINLNLAPVVDLNLNPANRIIGGAGRSFSGDAGVVTQQAKAFIAGHHEVGVLTAIKHFPGQGSASGDTHRGSVDVTGNWTDYELQPFANLIADGAVDAVMTSHIYNRGIDATYPATLSAPTLAILREQLGWQGVVISDDLKMAAISGVYRFADALALALNAGVDLLTIGQTSATTVTDTIDTIEALVRAGAVSEARIDEAYGRIMGLKARLAR
jgi:beta-N-acetylhexosaminidase